MKSVDLNHADNAEKEKLIEQAVAASKAPRYRLLPSWRFATACLVMFGYMMNYSIRNSLSMSLVCMVKQNASVTNATGNCPVKASSGSAEGAFLEWSDADQMIVLMGFYLGYIFSQVPGGFLAGKFGTKLVLGGCMIGGALSNLVSLGAVYVGDGVLAFAAARCLLGLTIGGMFPAAHGMIGRWAPPADSSSFTVIVFSGLNLGTIFGQLIGGELCKAGWYLPFVINTALAGLWILVWFSITANTPSKHKWISEEEKAYIIASYEEDEHVDFRVPWKELLTSPCSIAVIVAQVCSDYGNFTFLSIGAKYLDEVVVLTPEMNGRAQSLAYLLFLVTLLSSGPLADYFRKRYRTVTVRRVLAIIGFLGPAFFCVLLCFMSCDQQGLSVFIFVLAVGISGFQYGAWVVSHVDIAPRYAGVLYGIGNTLSAVSGVVTNLISLLIFQNDGGDDSKAAKFQVIFIVMAVITTAGCSVYCIFIKGEVQTWAMTALEKAVSESAHEMKPHKVESNKVALKTGQSPQSTAPLLSHNGSNVLVANT